MGLTSDRLKTGGLTFKRLAAEVPQEQEPGFFQGLVQSTAKPFLKTIATGQAAVESVIRPTDISYQPPKDYGYFGKATPVGYDENGNKLGYLRGMAQAFGIGAEITSSFVGGGGAVKAGATAFKETLKTGFKEAAKTGFKSGVLYGGGSALRRETEAPEKSIVESSLSVAIDALGSGVVGGITAGAVAGTTALGSAGIRKVADFVNPAFKETRINQLIVSNADKIRKALNLNKTQRAIESRSGKDVSQFLSEENLIPEVSNGKLVADDIISSLELKAKAENAKFEELLDGNYIPLNDAKTIALRTIRGFGKMVQKEVQDIEDEFNSLAQQFKNSPKDAEGNLLIPSGIANKMKQYFYSLGKYNKLATPEQQSAAANYRRLGGAFKDLIEDSVDDADARAFNSRLGDLQNAIFMLTEKNGMPVQGGRLGKYFARTIGSVVGVTHGPEGSIVGALTADKIADLLQDPRITTYMARQYLKILKQQGKQELIDQVNDIIERRTLERGGRRLLTPPSFIPMGEKVGESSIKVSPAQAISGRIPKTGRFTKIFTSNPKINP